MSGSYSGGAPARPVIPTEVLLDEARTDPGHPVEIIEYLASQRMAHARLAPGLQAAMPHPFPMC